MDEKRQELLEIFEQLPPNDQQALLRSAATRLAAGLDRHIRMAITIAVRRLTGRISTRYIHHTNSEYDDWMRLIDGMRPEDVSSAIAEFKEYIARRKDGK